MTGPNLVGFKPLDWMQYKKMNALYVVRRRIYVDLSLHFKVKIPKIMIGF